MHNTIIIYNKTFRCCLYNLLFYIIVDYESTLGIHFLEENVFLRMGV